MIHHGDCLDVMAAMEAESVSAVVTDPPYGLEFMGKAWDKIGAVTEPQSRDTKRWSNGSGVMVEGASGPFGGGGQRVRHGTSAKTMQAWHQQWAEAAFRVAKPSAYLLAFGGTRTVHRMTCAIEDAGWIIRDMLVWAYASGFPKSKASLKPAWEPIVMARKPGPLAMLNIDGTRIPVDPADPVNGAVWTSRPSAIRGGTQGFVTSMAEGDRNVANAGELGRWPANVILTDPIFDGGWEGVVGGGPQESHGDGRILTDNAQRLSEYGMGPSTRVLFDDTGTYSRFFLVPKADRGEREPIAGMLPEQHIALNGDGVPSDFMGQKSCGLCGEKWIDPDGLPRCRHGKDHMIRTPQHRSRQNHHPTVKPLDLMRHLVRLVTPTGGTILDPFLGSGTTGIAAEMEGVPWIGIEREAEYVAIAEARLEGVQRGMGLPA